LLSSLGYPESSTPVDLSAPRPAPLPTDRHAAFEGKQEMGYRIPTAYEFFNSILKPWNSLVNCVIFHIGNILLEYVCVEPHPHTSFPPHVIVDCVNIAADGSLYTATTFTDPQRTDFYRGFILTVPVLFQSVFLKFRHLTIFFVIFFSSTGAKYWHENEI
jgi:hypothetical protein